MDWPTFQGLATVAGGIAGFVIVAGAATTALGRLWRYRFVRIVCAPVTFPTRAVKLAVIEAASVTAEAFVRPIVADEVNRLMTPNGGNSVADVSRKVDVLAAAVEHLTAEFHEHKATSYERSDALEAKIDELIGGAS